MDTEEQFTAAVEVSGLGRALCDEAIAALQREALSLDGPKLPELVVLRDWLEEQGLPLPQAVLARLLQRRRLAQLERPLTVATLLEAMRKHEVKTRHLPDRLLLHPMQLHALHRDLSRYEGLSPAVRVYDADRDAESWSLFGMLLVFDRTPGSWRVYSSREELPARTFGASVREIEFDHWTGNLREFVTGAIAAGPGPSRPQKTWPQPRRGRGTGSGGV